jgi:hypothetical protein
MSVDLMMEPYATMCQDERSELQPPAGFPISLLVVDAFRVRLRVFKTRTRIFPVGLWPG